MITILLILVINVYADKYAGEIFKMGTGVRNLALGRTGLTDTLTPAPAYWNPALLINQTQSNFEIMHAEDFQGLVKYDTITGALTDYNLGFTVTRVGINNIKLTKVPDPNQEPGSNNRPYHYKTINTADYIIYVGLAREIRSISWGITPKFVYRNLAEKSAFGFGADLGAYTQPLEHFALGLKIRDLIPTQVYWENGTRENVHTGFDLEAKMNTQMPKLSFPVNLYFNLETNTEGIQKYSLANIGDFSFDPHIGAEFIVHPIFSFFAGYDLEYLTAGLGLSYQKFQLNYAFKQNTELNNSHRISLGYSY